MSMMNANAAATTAMTANEPLDFVLPEMGDKLFTLLILMTYHCLIFVQLPDRTSIIKQWEFFCPPYRHKSSLEPLA